MKTIPTIMIDGKVYDLELLSVQTRHNIRMLQQTNKEIERLELQLAITRTARINYANAVKEGIEAYPIYPEYLALQ
jgi:hypothetical protein